MPDLTRRKVNDAPESWAIFYGDIDVGRISQRMGAPRSEPQWQWFMGFQPGPPPGTAIVQVADTFEAAREAFGKAWPTYLADRTDDEFAEYRRWQE